jgi:hypothetical protein
MMGSWSDMSNLRRSRFLGTVRTTALLSRRSRSPFYKKGTGRWKGDLREAFKSTESCSREPRLALPLSRRSDGDHMQPTKDGTCGRTKRLDRVRVDHASKATDSPEHLLTEQRICSTYYTVNKPLTFTTMVTFYLGLPRPCKTSIKRVCRLCDDEHRDP